jgi:multidrug efflux system outer membrane protein
LTMPIFDGGLEFHNLDLAKSEFREAVDTYKQSVLTAFREVEDSLSDIRLTKEQSAALIRSSAASRRAAELAQKRYEEGDQDYFQTYVIQSQALQAERNLAQAQGQGFNATINLIRALGGGWTMKIIAKDDAAFKAE